MNMQMWRTRRLFRARFSDPSGTVALPVQQPADMPKLSPESHARPSPAFKPFLAQYGTRFSEAQKADIPALLLGAAAAQSFARLPRSKR